MKKLLPTLLIFFVFISVSAQKQDIDNRIYKPDSTHNPRKAVMHSLIIPGWGQSYNHQAWKDPIIYAALGSFASAIIYNQNYYAEFIALAKIKRTGSIPTQSGQYYSLYKKYKAAYELYGDRSADNLADIANNFVRNRDLSILGFLGFWGLNVIDAYISAKFIRSYTMDNNLSLNINPELMYNGNYSANNIPLVPSLKITIGIN